MNRVLICGFLLLFFFLSGCKKEPVNDDILLDVRIHQTPANQHTYVSFSEFIGNHRIIELEASPSVQISVITTIIKKENIYYVISSFNCFLFDINGRYIKTIGFSGILQNENAWISGYDICTVNGHTELWIGSGFDEQIIYRTSLDDGSKQGEVRIKKSFKDFKVIDGDKIIVTNANDSYLMSAYKLNGTFITQGLEKRSKDNNDGERLMKYDDLYLLAYPFTTYSSYYDTHTNTFKDIFLVKDEQGINTIQNQTELIEKYGVRRGTKIAMDNYMYIDYIVKNNTITCISFCKNDKQFLGIKREENPFKIIEIFPDKYAFLQNDISGYPQTFRQLINNFKGRSYSDDSVLFFLLSDLNNVFEPKSRNIKIIELMD